MGNNKSEIGVFGLGVMGSALSLNLADHGFNISVYNRNEGSEEGLVDKFLRSNSDRSNISGFTDLTKFILSIEQPRKIILMISASALDQVISQLTPLLNPEDILIDAGNSHYKDTRKRQNLCGESDIEFLGVGVSGGEKGARFGPSIMPGGSKNAYKNVSDYLNQIAAKDKNGNPCISYIGPEGAGHFVKMVHNGIEYVEMQLLAEIYHLLHIQYSNEEISKILADWNEGSLHSFLLEITSKILLKKEGSDYILDRILDKAGNKGTGSWSTISALELGSENSMMSSAVFARYMSSMKGTRTNISATFQADTTTSAINFQELKAAYDISRKLNHLQGFELMRLASTEFDWNLNLSEIARIWTNGCIIRSNLMEEFTDRFKLSSSLFENALFIEDFRSNENSLSSVMKSFIENRIAAPSFSAAWNYWIGLSTENGPANLIQAQRDFFGAHTYQKIDDPSGASYHTNWE